MTDSTQRRMRTLWAVLACAMPVLLSGAGVGLLGPVLPDIASELGMRRGDLSVVFTIMYASSWVIGPIVGFWADRFGKRRMYLIIGLIVCAGYLLLSQAVSFLTVALAVVLASTFGAAWGAIGIAFVADLNPARTVRNLNLLQSTFSFGAAAALTASALAPGLSASWRASYIVLAAMALAGVVMGLSLHVKQSGAEVSHTAPARARLWDRYFLLLAIAIGIYVGTEISMAAWIGAIGKDLYQFTRAQAMLTAALFWMGMGIGRVIVASLGGMLGTDSLLRLCIWISAFAYVLLLLPAGPWRVVAGAGLVGFGFCAFWPSIVALGNRHRPGRSGAVVAVLMTSGNVGGAIFPWVLGLALDRVAPQLGLYAMAAVFGFMAFILTVALRHGSDRN